MRAHSSPGTGGPPFHPPSQTPGAASAGRRAPTPTRPRQQRPRPPVPGFGAALPGPRYIAKGKHGHGWAQDGLPAPLPPLLTRIHPLFCGRGGAETGQRAGGGEARSKGVDSGKGMRAGPVTDTPHLASPPLPSHPRCTGTPTAAPRHLRQAGAAPRRGLGRMRRPRPAPAAGVSGAGRGAGWDPLRPPVGPRAQRPGPARGGGGGASRPSEGRGTVEPAVCRCLRVPSALRAGSPVLAPPQISRGRFGLPEESSSIPGRPVWRWHCRSRRFDGTGRVCPVWNYIEQWSGKYRAGTRCIASAGREGNVSFPLTLRLWRIAKNVIACTVLFTIIGMLRVLAYALWHLGTFYSE